MLPDRVRHFCAKRWRFPFHPPSAESLACSPPAHQAGQVKGSHLADAKTPGPPLVSGEIAGRWTTDSQTPALLVPMSNGELAQLSGAAGTHEEESDGNGHHPRRHRDLLQELGDRPAGRVQPRLAAQRRRVGRPGVFRGLARLPCHRPRPPRPRPLRSALGRKRHGHLRRRPGRADGGPGPARRGPGRAFHRRRGGHPLPRPPRQRPGRQGRAGGRGATADAQDRRQPRRPADRDLRRHPRGRDRGPVSVLPRPERAVLRSQPARLHRLRRACGTGSG